jgi:hypothetical protein
MSKIRVNSGKFPKIEQVLTWYPRIKREFPEDEKDFGEWYYV